MKRLPLLLTACAMLAVVASGVRLVAERPAVPAEAQGSSQADAAMRHHFAETMRVHDAVVRGDVPAARRVAGELAGRDFPGLPGNAGPHLAAMKDAARLVASSADVASASAAAATMLGACGECHRAVGAMPAVAVTPLKPVGDTVGHMLAHQHAAELLVQGLVVPSSATWHQGAQELRTAPLKRSKLPKDRKLTSEIVAGEARLHELADQAAGSTSTAARTEVYGQMVATCASCHAVHANIWGPAKR
jgi:mono/diheme cytochrome c family protein